MTVRLEELLAAATEREWSSSPVAWETSLRSRIPFNAEAAALIAEWIALAPEMARLLIEWARDDPERLARLDRLGNTA